MIGEITPYQLIAYLQFAALYAKRINTELTEAEKLCKKLMEVAWDEDAKLVIMEKPL